MSTWENILPHGSQRLRLSAVDWCILTSTAYLVPAVVAVVSQYMYLAILGLLISLISTMRHAVHHQLIVSIDVVIATLVTVVHLYHAFFVADLLHGTTALGVFVSGYIYFRRARISDYDRNHSIWHLISAFAMVIIATS